jgi:hypothetical protein
VHPLLSVAVTVNDADPLAVGVPVSAPDVESDIPAGNDPLVMLKVYGVFPPDAVHVCEYAVPTNAPGNVEGETVIAGHGGGVTSKLNVFEFVLACASVTVNVRLFVPVVVPDGTVAV